MKKTQSRTSRRPRRPAGRFVHQSQAGRGAVVRRQPRVASPPAVPAVFPTQILPAITASLDLPVGPEGLIDSVSAKFERFVMEQIRAGEQVSPPPSSNSLNANSGFRKWPSRPPNTGPSSPSRTWSRPGGP